MKALTLKWANNVSEDKTHMLIFCKQQIQCRIAVINSYYCRLDLNSIYICRINQKKRRVEHYPTRDVFEIKKKKLKEQPETVL